jgi:hypothetical protein
MQSSSIDQISLPVGPKIVRAWFESAINPLLIGLESEAALLRNSTCTWRAHSREMLAIIPVRSHIPYGIGANLDQFLSFHENVAALCKAHDLSVAELAEACGRMYDSLLANLSFKNAIETACQSDRVNFPPGQTRAIFTETPELNKVVGWIAEYVVNSSGPLGSQYVAASIWNAFREEFLAYREKLPIRAIWTDVERIRRELLETVDQLLSSLRNTRNSLSLQFDVPPAPLEGRE